MLHLYLAHTFRINQAPDSGEIIPSSEYITLENPTAMGFSCCFYTWADFSRLQNGIDNGSFLA